MVVTYLHSLLRLTCLIPSFSNLSHARCLFPKWPNWNSISNDACSLLTAQRGCYSQQGSPSSIHLNRSRLNLNWLIVYALPYLRSQSLMWETKISFVQLACYCVSAPCVTASWLSNLSELYQSIFLHYACPNGPFFTSQTPFDHYFHTECYVPCTFSTRQSSLASTYASCSGCESAWAGLWSSRGIVDQASQTCPPC